jgi:Uma2 family endonuclease
MIGYPSDACYRRPDEDNMNLQPDLRMDKAAFIAWSATAEDRCELVEGRVVMMPRPSRAHARVVGHLYFALRRRLDPLQWEVIVEFGLDAGPQTMRYPDVMVDRAGGGAKDYVAAAPVLLAEVLSPSSAEIDLGDKAAEYLHIASVLAYLVFAQDEPKAWVWMREDAKLAPERPEVFAGIEATIRVGGLDLDLPLTELYSGIALG